MVPLLNPPKSRRTVPLDCDFPYTFTHPLQDPGTPGYPPVYTYACIPAMHCNFTTTQRP
jgi:hypothetical protein